MVPKFASLIQFADQLESPSVSLAPCRCLLRRHKEAPCRLCFDACPTQAVIKGDPVALDNDRCVNCGLCLHLCPMEAFTGPGNRAGKLLNVLGTLDDGRVELACPRKDKMAVTRAKVSTVIEVKPCLASISLPTLLAAVTQPTTKDGSGGAAKLWMNDEPCEACPIGSVQGEISRIAEAANQLLAAFGEEPRVLTYRGSPDLLGKKIKKRPVEQGNRSRYTRRGFFRSLTSPVERAFEDGFDSSPSDVPSSPHISEDEENGMKRLSETRDSLVRSLRWLGQPLEAYIDMTGLPFGSVSIEGECVGCGLCARFCPSEALIFEEEAGNFRIDFTTSGCLGCTICALICPTKAVEMKPEVETDQLLAGTAKTLMTGDLADCQECGMSCAANQDEPLCFVCRWRKTIPMADIYGRLDNPSQTTKPVAD